MSASDAGHAQRIIAAVHGARDFEVRSVSDRTFLLHLGGTITVENRTPLKTRDDLSMANPTPEEAPESVPSNVSIVATGRSDYPNQINNVLCFPGIFKGALSVRAREINESMKLAAARAIASVITPDELSTEHIIPSVFNRRVAAVVARAVARSAVRTGVARRVPKSSAGAIADIS